MLQNEYLVVKFCFDTAENEPSKVCPIEPHAAPVTYSREPPRYPPRMLKIGDFSASGAQTRNPENTLEKNLMQAIPASFEERSCNSAGGKRRGRGPAVRCVGGRCAPPPRERRTTRRAWNLASRRLLQPSPRPHGCP